MKNQLTTDPTLTTANATKRGYEYNTDVIYKPEASNAQYIESLLAKGYKLGQPSKKTDVPENIQPTLYGLYEPLTKELLFLQSIKPDTTLTPQTAEQKGYQWIEDGIFFDPDAGTEVNQEVINYIKQGYKLGQPSDNAHNLPEHQYFGLYQPHS